MSAQAGLLYFDGRAVDREFLERIDNALLPYGSDGGGQHVSGSIGMLYRAFHTTRESRIEKQPYVSKQGSIMTWDGRLDNRDELIPVLCNDLEEHGTDVAIVMAAYDRWGTNCFRKLIGDWALTVWNPEERSLTLAKDYMGVRHLYYRVTRDKVVWSTDLAVIVLNSERPFTLDNEYVAGYLAAYPETHLTPYREIQAVPAGKFLRLWDGNATVHTHWAFEPRNRIRYKTDAEYEEHFRHEFRQAVRRRLRTDSPILAELSGGLDSSSIVCVADDIIAAHESDTPRLDTISRYNPQEPGGDERPYFMKVEEKRGKTGCHLDVSQVDPFSVPIPDKSHVMPGPLGEVQKIDADCLALMKRQGNRVLLSGIGGDEFMGGVPDPRFQLADLIIQFRFLKLAKQLMAWSLVKRTPWIQLLLQSLIPLLPTAVRARLQKEARIEAWIDPRFARRFRLSRLRLDPRPNMRFWLPSQAENLRTLETVTRQISSVIMRPQKNIEKRFPFLDRDLVEFLTSIPANQLLRPGQRRSLMRRSLASLLPQEVLHRKSKSVSSRFYMAAFESHWSELQEILSSLVSSHFGYMRRDRLEAAIGAVRNGDATQVAKVLRAISFELWLRHLPAHTITFPDALADLSAQTTLLQSGAQAFRRF